MIDYFDDIMSMVGSYEGYVTLIKSEHVLSSKCSPKIRYKVSEVTDLTRSVIELKTNKSKDRLERGVSCD